MSEVIDEMKGPVIKIGHLDELCVPVPRDQRWVTVDLRAGTWGFGWKEIDGVMCFSVKRIVETA
jgi:hypothetical protein